jgi:hypothetical protein
VYIGNRKADVMTDYTTTQNTQPSVMTLALFIPIGSKNNSLPSTNKRQKRQHTNGIISITTSQISRVFFDLETPLPLVLTNIIVSYLNSNDVKYLCHDWKTLPVQYFIENQDPKFLLYKKWYWDDMNLLYSLLQPGLFFWFKFVITQLKNPWTQRLIITEGVVRTGSLELLKWARANAYPWGTHTCCTAAVRGHIDILQYARANGCPWDEKTCSWAAEGGYLEVLKWARTNGCPWDVDTCYRAVQYGHLELLKWARANECPWDERIQYAALIGKHAEVTQWARANGCPWNDDLMT